MILDNKFMPWLLTDETRNDISGAFYDKGAHVLRVTDGRALAVLPVRDDEDDEQGLIPVAALKESRKAAKGRTALPWTLTIKDGRVTAPHSPGAQSWALIALRNAPYPDFGMFMPKWTQGKTRTARLLINPYLLAQLWRACGIEEGRKAAGALLEFELDDEDDAANKPIIVKGAGMKATLAGFMPMRLESRAPNRIDDADRAQEEYGNGNKKPCAMCCAPVGHCVCAGLPKEIA